MSRPANPRGKRKLHYTGGSCRTSLINMFYNYNDRSSHISILMLMIIMIIAVLKSVKILTDDDAADDLYSGDREVGTADK